MLPYLTAPAWLPALPVALAVGGALGASLMLRLAQQVPAGQRAILSALPFGIAFGLLGAFLVHVVAYGGPGLASAGALGFGLPAAWLAGRLRGVPLRPVAGPVAAGLALAAAIGRLGCVLAHDHPGRPSPGPFSVAYPDGARLEPALYEVAALAAIAALAVRALRTGQASTRVAAAVALAWAAQRFALDLLRDPSLAPPLGDLRHLGLTAAQWLALGVGPVAAALLRRTP
jgi:prolipoprotein diacylglyceryltransferase